jgi:hypothetical protein
MGSGGHARKLSPVNSAWLRQTINLARLISTKVTNCTPKPHQTLLAASKSAQRTDGSPRTVRLAV